jgi:2-methylcitrate dehydratase PrpD
VFAAAAMPMRADTAVPPQATQPRANADVTGRLARYMVAARDRALPPDALRETRHRVLDTIAAMVSGARLKPGEMAIKYVRTLGGTPEASVLTTDFRTSAVNAALINGMLAHADETDDFEPATKAHPGCSVVPAALAIAEREGRSGQEFLTAVALGYDVCCRFLLALGADHVRGTHRSAEGTSARLAPSAPPHRSRGSMSQACAMRSRTPRSRCPASGAGWAIPSTSRRPRFRGMGARNGVTAATMVQAGFSGVPDVLRWISTCSSRCRQPLIRKKWSPV